MSLSTHACPNPPPPTPRVFIGNLASGRKSVANALPLSLGQNNDT